MLVTLLVAMTMYQARHYLQKEGVNLAHSFGVRSHHGRQEQRQLVGHRAATVRQRVEC